MNMRTQCFSFAKKSGAAVFVLTLIMASAAFSQNEQPIQWKQPTEEQLKQMRGLIAKSRAQRQNFPTKEQMEELDNELVPVDARLKNLHQDAESLSDKNEAELKTDLVSRGTIAAAISIHKKFRAAYFDAISIYSKWGARNHREDCVRQAAKALAYLTPISDKWLATMPAMSLANEADRAAALNYMNLGERNGFTMGAGGWSGGAELIRLHGVCGGVAESEPGTTHKVNN